jgi:hypothetical protein
MSDNEWGDDIAYDDSAYSAQPELMARIAKLPRSVTLADKYTEEAEMILAAYDRSDTNDGACRVAEVARGLCKMHAKYDASFGRDEYDAYMNIVFRSLHAARECRS